MKGIKHSEEKEKLILKIKKLQEENELLKQENKHILSQQKYMDTQLFDYYSLLRAARGLHHAKELSKFVRILQTIVYEKFDIKEQWLFIYDDRKEKFKLYSEDEEQFEFFLEEGILWQLLCQGEPFLIVDLNGDFRFKNLFISKGLNKFPAVLWLPLAMEDHPLGILALGKKDNRSIMFSDLEREFLRTLGEQASVALSSISLYRRLKDKQDALDRTIRNLSVLYDISRAVSQIDNMKKLLLEILDKAIERVNASKGSIMLYDPKLKKLKLQVVRGLPDRELEEKINSGSHLCRMFKPGEGIAGKVFASGEPYISNKVDEDENFERGELAHTKSILCLPLLSKNKPVGVINITNKKEGQFDREDVEILTAIANQAALTIEKADLYQLAITDELTQLYIRRYFLRKLDEEWERFNRYKTTFSIIMMDLDHFKKINDTYGHPVGDRVLRRVGYLLKRGFRGVDIVCRYGGEEFAVLLPETGIEGAKKAATRVQGRIREAKIPLENGKELKVTVSIGICEVDKRATSVEDVIKGADIALYKAKKGGRDRIEVWTWE